MVVRTIRVYRLPLAVRWTANVLASLLLAGCSGLDGRAPTRDEFDPAGFPSRPPEEPAVAPDTKSAEELLAEYARRLREGYPLYPGDEVRFNVLGHADLSFEARVPSEAEISFPLIGKVRLVGRTLEEVRRDIAERLGKDYLVDPDVTIFVKAYSRKTVYLLGAVSKPQEYEVPSGRVVTLLQTIAQAGGFLEEAAKHQVTIFRQREIGSSDRISIPVNVVGLQEGREKDPVVIPDDVIFVPSREKVFVLGQVSKPGGYVVDADHGLLASQAISLAGGFTRIGNDSNVRLIRRHKDGARKTYVLNLSRVVSGHPEDDVPLQPGDVLFVPESLF